MPLDDQIRRRLKVQNLHILITVVEAGTMGKAAERLNTSPPAISRAIADLERTIGVRLLDRHRQGVEPTEYGRALVDSGSAMFDDLHQGLKKIEFLADPTGGEVRLGGTPPIAAGLISSVIDRLSRRYPKMMFHLAVTDVATLHRQLSERNIDFVIDRRLGPFADEQLGFDHLFDDSFFVVAGAQNPWVRRRGIALSELANEPWALPARESALGSLLVEAFRASGLDYPQATLSTLSVEVRNRLVATGRFLSVISSSVLRFPAKHPDIKALSVEFPLLPVPVGIVTLKNRTLNPVARLFIDTAREFAKPLGKRK